MSAKIPCDDNRTCNDTALAISTTVFVAGLAPRIGQPHLQKLFEKFGKIRRLDLKEKGTSKYCFCEFQTVEQATEAINKLHGRMLLQRKLIVKPAQERKSHILRQKTVDTPNISLHKQRRAIEAKIASLKKKLEVSSKGSGT